MRIQHNIPAMNAYRNYNANTKALQGNLQKLSSGYKINKAGDDAAGLAISEKMRAQITGLEVAQKNAKDGISLVQTAEGAMTEIHTMLNRMFSLAEQSANGTYDDEVDRVQLNNEFEKLQKEIDRIADATNFNGKKLLNGKIGETETTDDEQAVIKASTSAVDATADDAKVTVSSPFAFGTDATNDDKTAINEILQANTLDIKLTANGSSKLDTGTASVTTTALDSALSAKGYKLQVQNALGNFVDASTINKYDPSGTNATDIKNSTIKFKITSATDTTKNFGTIEVDVPSATTSMTNSSSTNSGANVTKIKFSAPPDDIKGAELDKGTGNTALSTYGIDSIDFSGVTVEEGADVKVDWDGTNLTVSIGNDSYKYTPATADTATALAGKEAELTKTGGTDKITVKFAAGQTAVGKGTTAVAGGAQKVGVTKAGEDDAEKESGLRLRVGDSTNSYDDIYVDIKSMKIADLTGMDGSATQKAGIKLKDLKVTDPTEADKAMGALKDMINYVSDQRGNLGATQNRLDHTINNLSTMQENIQDAEATIRDVDVAEEMMKYTKNNILVQSAQAMLAQANQLPQGVLQLLG